MSRIINVDSPSKIRNQRMRTSAEILRQLSQKPELDEEAKDMVAHLVYCLRDINETIEHSAEVWEKRNYWIKAEELRRSWDWVIRMIADTESLIRNDDWASFPSILAGLFQHVGNIKIKKMTRSSDTWDGDYAKLMDEMGDH
jgi:hypothetical protein